MAGIYHTPYGERKESVVSRFRSYGGRCPEQHVFPLCLIALTLLVAVYGTCAAPLQSQKVSWPAMVTNSIGMQFVLIPAGQFRMGFAGRDADHDEQPVHTVMISQPFYLGKYEVTQQQWRLVMGNNPSRFTGDEARPVEQVSWEDVQAFIHRLNLREQSTNYRLPTEAEWEYAARAGSATMYSFGNDMSLLGTYAWYADNSQGTTHPVGQLKPNAWGLHDLYGNVWEWVHDRYGAYTDTTVTDPQGATVGSDRLVRGGSWPYHARYCRSAYRYGLDPTYRFDSIGFRLVKTIP